MLPREPTFLAVVSPLDCNTAKFPGSQENDGLAITRQPQDAWSFPWDCNDVFATWFADHDMI